MKILSTLPEVELINIPLMIYNEIQIWAAVTQKVDGLCKSQVEK